MKKILPFRKEVKKDTAMDDSDIIISSIEVIKDRLYFATLKKEYKPKPTRNSKYVTIPDDIIYEGYYFDFGPYHLCHLYQFCNMLNEELEANPKKKVVFYSSDQEFMRLNAAYLIGCYQIIYLQASPVAVYKQLTSNTQWALLNFRDASCGPPLYVLPLSSVLQGVKVALDLGFFDFKSFNEEEYLHYEKVENGDLNWIIPQKMLAFSGPSHKTCIDKGYPLHSPEFYFEYFRKHNVTTIVRLNNKKSYDARQFTSFGFNHRDLFFEDGSTPTTGIVQKFLKISEAAKGAIAVHCRAGLGRTGTLIACFMMKHYNFTAQEAIAWLRICRPGSVIRHQQYFLERIECTMLEEGRLYRRTRRMLNIPRSNRGVYSILPLVDSNSYPKPVSLNSILDKKDINKLDNADIVNGNEADTENNITQSDIKPTPLSVVTKTVYTPKLHYMLPTNSVRNANNTNLKTQPRIISKSYAAKTSTFPPSRSAASTKLIGTLKTPFSTKTNLTQRANLSRTTNYMHGGSLKTRKKPEVVATVTTTLSALTENCHLSKNVDKKTTVTKKKLVQNSLRKKIVKTGQNLESSQELSSSDTNITNISADSLETPLRRRKRDKSSPESMECHSEITPECEEEGPNSQGNKLYKIKALRKKNVPQTKRVQTRSSCASGSAVKKK